MVKYAESTIEDIDEKVSLLDYAKDIIDLELKGNDYFGICPFHNENTPSFSISPHNNTFFCFGCGRGGSIINFVMLYHNLNFPKAIKHLLEYANIDEKQLKKESETLALFKKMYKLIEKSKKNVEHTILLPDIMDRYEFSGLEPWKKEGISDAILTKYQYYIIR
jgi:DNA primase